MPRTLKPSLSLSDTALLKGVAILLIIIHNFCHWLPVCALENEYKFYLKRTWVLVDFLAKGEHVVLNLFAYAGHYGVPLFLFLSGYGLVKKYEEQASTLPPVKTGRFMWNHATKLWLLLLPALPLWLLTDLHLHDWKWTHTYSSVIHLLAYIGNFFPTQPFIIGPHWLRTLTRELPRQDLLMGPWWFFSLIMQLYLFYKLLFYRRGKWPLIVTTALCMALLLVSVLIRDPHMDMLCWLRYNAVGSMLPFVMGIWMARYGLYQDLKLVPVWLLLFAICCFNKVAWLLTPFFFTLACLPLAGINGKLRNILEWVGKLSAILFVVHPIVRAYFIKWIGLGGNWYLSIASYLVITFLLALFYKRYPLSRLLKGFR